jgi:hypothetical protein
MESTGGRGSAGGRVTDLFSDLTKYGYIIDSEASLLIIYGLSKSQADRVAVYFPSHRVDQDPLWPDRPEEGYWIATIFSLSSAAAEFFVREFRGYLLRELTPAAKVRVQ